MGVHVQVPITTAVIEENASCVVRGDFEAGAVMIHLDACRQNHHAVLGLSKRTKLHWSKEVRSFEVQELSSLPWPIRYHVTTKDAWYKDAQGSRVHYTPPLQGVDAKRGVTHVVQRAAILLIVVGAIGYRRAAWLR